MTENERELIQIIREAEDTAKAMVMAIEMMRRLIAGEDEQSIAASYGIKLEEVISA